VTELVALEMRGGPKWVRQLRDLWDSGAAVAPIDPSLPPPARAAALAALRPAAVVSGDGRRQECDAGPPLQTGDALVVLSSGTTGPPKPAVFTHDTLAIAATLTNAASDAAEGSHWLACLPLHHVGGLSVITRALLGGTGLTVLDRFDPTAVTAARATHVSLVPAQLKRIDPVVFRTILLGGSTIPHDRPPNAIATYGMTETFGGVVYDGRPLPGVEVVVAAGPGETGLIKLRSPTLLRCWRDGTDPRDAAGHINTNDLGWIDTRGELHVAGRADDVIITGGEKVWPNDVEAVLVDVAGVADVGVVGRPDATYGSVVTAIVVPEHPATPPSLESLRAATAEVLPRHAVPRRVEYRRQLPRTSLGKLRRAELRSDTEPE
jgi:O-succinylbenzoic acid--CoA ligase